MLVSLEVFIAAKFPILCKIFPSDFGHRLKLPLITTESVVTLIGWYLYLGMILSIKT